MAGFFGSGHCLGMCGPVVVLFETGEGSWRRRIAYNAGRAAFYVLLGTVAAGLGAALTQIAGVQNSLYVLRIVAALLVIALGLNLLFNLRILAFLESAGAGLWRKLAPLARRVVPMTSMPRAFAAGFLWGALPCGLVYSALAIAATSGTAVSGALVMLAFWLGTLPALIAAGASAGRIRAWSGRPLVRRLAGVLMMAIGAFALAMPLVHQSDGAHDHGQHVAMQYPAHRQASNSGPML